MNRLFLFILFSMLLANFSARAQQFKVLAFFTAREDQAHISFVHEANSWFAKKAQQYDFTYDSTNNWDKLNSDTLAQYNVILFLDTRPEKKEQQVAFENYMRNGGAWIGFHFAAFALSASAYPNNWSWYHDVFLGSGEYKSNTWRPVPAILKVMSKNFSGVAELPDTFRSAANEWYRWQNDLRLNPDIDILLSIDSSSFPLGTGPKPQEIWHSGFYPVAWTNKKYNMLYMNMGHNDIDYEGKTNATLSSSFSSEMQNRFLLQSLFFLAKKQRTVLK